MANPLRTWVIAINNAFSNQSNRVLQYQEAAFNWKVNKLSAGWTVLLSSDGDAGASIAPGGGNVGAGDNWTSAAGLGVDNTAGGGAWIIMQAPSVFLQAGESLFAKAFINDATAQPKIFQIQWSTVTYTGGTTTTLPTTVGSETSVITGGDEIITWNAAVNGRYATWRSTRGDTMLMVKQEGTNEIESIVLEYSMSDASGGGQGGYRVLLWQQDGGGNFTTNTIMGVNARTFNSVGSLAVNAVDHASNLSQIASDDLDFNNEVIVAPSNAIVDVASGVRELGNMVDIFAAPNAGVVATIFGRLISGESGQVQRRVALGQMYFYAPTASLPFL